MMEPQEIKITLPEPHPGQQQVLNSKARWKVLMNGRRWGKSLICHLISIQHMLEGKHVAYVTPTHELGRVFYQDIINYLPAEVILTDNKTDRKIELVTGGSLTFFSGESEKTLNSFRGLKFHLIIVDEASVIPDLKKAWGTAMRPTLTDYKGSAIFIATPNGKEFFYSLFQRAKNGEPGYESFHFTTYDNPTLPPGEVDEMKKDMTEAQFNQEVLAIAGENAANPIGTDHIRNNTITNLSEEPTVVYGIDVAKHTDFTVITGLDAKGRMSYFERFQTTWNDAKERVEALPADALKVIDSTGVGAVLFEALQLTCHNIIGFVFTEPSKLKMMTELVKDIQKGDIRFNQETADEMYVFQYTRTPSGGYKYAAQSGYHDDTIMALALANHHKNQALSTAEWKLY